MVSQPLVVGQADDRAPGAELDDLEPEVVVERDRRGHPGAQGFVVHRRAYWWIAQPSTARAASRTASEIVGCGVDDPGQLLVAALERDRVDQLGDHVAGAVADDVGAEDLAVLGVDDELHDPVAVVVDRRGADPAELHLADLDVLAGVLRLLLGHPDARHLRVAEGRAGDEVGSTGWVGAPAIVSAATTPSS